jgi:hypothetical protein
MNRFQGKQIFGDVWDIIDAYYTPNRLHDQECWHMDSKWKMKPLRLPMIGEYTKCDMCLVLHFAESRLRVLQRSANLEMHVNKVLTEYGARKITEQKWLTKSPREI